MSWDSRATWGFGCQVYISEGGGSWDSGATSGFGCWVYVGGGGVMGFWSHLGIWLSGVGGGGEEEEDAVSIRCSVRKIIEL